MPVATTQFAILTALLAAIGWVATQIFGWYKDGVARELTIRLKVIERQIEEFYGPLSSLANQIEDAREIRGRLIKAYIAAFKRGIMWNQSKMTWETTDEERKRWPMPDKEIEAVTEEEVNTFRNELPISTMRFYSLETFIFPLYDQASKVLTEKLHLLDSPALPETYREFMRHALMNRLQNRLFIDKNIASNFTAARDYPKQFATEVTRDLNGLRQEYRRLQGQVAQTEKWRSAFFLRGPIIGSQASTANLTPR